MSERVISAFASSNNPKQTDPAEIYEKVKSEIESTINENHPKVKTLLEEQTRTLEKKLQKQKE